MAEKSIPEFFAGATKSSCNLVLNQVQDGISCLDKDRRVVFWNESAEQMTGFES